MTKAIITRDIEILGMRERPRINASLSLKASPYPQTLPDWAIKQAEARGAAQIVQPRRTKKKDSESEADEASETGLSPAALIPVLGQGREERREAPNPLDGA